MRTLIASLSLLLLVAGVAAAKPTADESTAAREHYKRGTTLYDLGKYEEAIAEFQQAYEIKDDPVLLYNIAQSYRLANKYQDALRFYRTYLRKSPKAPNRDEVETKIADMENLIAQQAKVARAPSVDVIPAKGDRPADISQPPVDNGTKVAAQTPTNNSGTQTPTEKTDTTPTKTDNTASQGNGETPPGLASTDNQAGADQPKPGRSLLIAGIVIAVAGVAVAAAGIGLGAVASSDSKKQETNTTFDPALESQGKSFGTIGPALAGVGGVLVVAGVVVAVIGATKKPAESPKVSLVPSVGRNSAGAAFTLRF